MATEQEMQAVVIAQQTRIKELEANERRATVDAALATALANSGLPLHAHSGQHLVPLLRDSVAVYTDPTSGRPVVGGPNLTPLADHVKAKLASPEYAHFLHGGGGGGSAAAGQGGQGGAVTEPQTLLEATLLKMAEMKAARAQPVTIGGVECAADSEPFGFRASNPKS